MDANVTPEYLYYMDASSTDTMDCTVELHMGYIDGAWCIVKEEVVVNG